MSIFSPSPKTPSPEQPRRSRAAGLRWVIAFVVLIIVLPIGIMGVRFGLEGHTLMQTTKRLEADVAGVNFEAAEQDALQARQSLDRMKSMLQSTGFMRDFPWIGTQIRAVEDVIGASIGTLDSVSDILRVAHVVVDAVQEGAEAQGVLEFRELRPEEKRHVLQALYSELPRLRLARDKMDIASELWKRVSPTGLTAPLYNAIEPIATGIPKVQQALDQAVPLLEVLIPLAGYPEAQSYIIALQNNAELRPGGGFIGTIGTMTWDAGELTALLIGDVYALDNPVAGVWKDVPPAPLQKYLGVRQWFLRDANWSPDFPTSANRVRDVFARETALITRTSSTSAPPTFIAFEPGFFRELLKITGPITADGERYDAETFFEKIEYKVEVEWHQKGIPVEKRKQIIADIGDALMQKISSLPASRWPEVLRVVTDAFSRKQIMMSSADVRLQKLFDERGWTARAKATNGDFLWVVDANLAALKTDGAMQKKVSYTVDMQAPGGPIADVRLTYTNTAPGFTDYRFTRYRSYTRVYVPEGSQLISSSGAMENDLHLTRGVLVPGTVDVMRDLGKTVFGAFWSVEPGQTGTLTFRYRLPEAASAHIREGKYRLDWQKQPGADTTELTVRLLLGKNIITANPPEPKEAWGDQQYDVEADSLEDRIFNVSF